MRFIGPAVKSLSRLAIGSLTLAPEFDPETLEYTVTTGNASNKVTAEATDSGDTVQIMNGETEIESGESASWEVGENILTITVTDRDDPTASTEYVVTVTREEPEPEEDPDEDPEQGPESQEPGEE